ncbi:MAG: DUF3592 domain-containing protein [Anaerolineales bacterium]
MKTSVVLWIIGLALIVAAVFFYRRAADFRESAVLTTSTIVGFTQQGQEGTQNCSVLSYTAENGESYQHFSNQCGFGQDLGDEIELYYDPNEPERVQIRSFTSTWLATLLLGIPGILSIGLGVGLMPKTKKAK